MSKLVKKATVRFPEYPPAMIHMLAVLSALTPGRVQDIVITSANDSTHGKTSRHYRNEAVDIRSKTIGTTFSRASIQRHSIVDGWRVTIERALGPQFRVLLENFGEENEHFHVQVKKGTKYDPAKIVTEVVS